MYAIVDGDLIVGRTTVIQPHGLRLDGGNYRQLRFDGSDIVDISSLGESVFYIDADGIKHVVEGEGWQALACRFDDSLVLDEGIWRIRSSADDALDKVLEIKDECQRRIYSRWDQAQQWNALAGADGYTSEDLAECLSWVNSCRASRDALINHPDLVELDVTDDQYWPAIS